MATLSSAFISTNGEFWAVDSSTLFLLIIIQMIPSFYVLQSFSKRRSDHRSVRDVCLVLFNHSRKIFLLSFWGRGNVREKTYKAIMTKTWYMFNKFHIFKKWRWVLVRTLTAAFQPWHSDSVCLEFARAAHLLAPQCSLVRSWAHGTVEYFYPVFKESWITVLDWLAGVETWWQKKNIWSSSDKSNCNKASRKHRYSSISALSLERTVKIRMRHKHRYLQLIHLQ